MRDNVNEQPKLSSNEKKPGRDSLDALFTLAYEELRRMASRVRRDNPSATLNPTALVNEAWLKLAKSRDFSPMSVDQFKGVAAGAIRQFLLLDESIDGISSGERDIYSTARSVQELEQLESRQAKVGKYGYFRRPQRRRNGPLVRHLGITVHRDWRFAKTWLAVRAKTRASANE